MNQTMCGIEVVGVKRGADGKYLRFCLKKPKMCTKVAAVALNLLSPILNCPEVSLVLI